MKKLAFVIALAFCSYNSFGQKGIFCFPAAEKNGIKTDNNLTDYLEFQICNQSKLKIIGVVVGYDKYLTRDKNKAGKEIVRTKVSVLPQSKSKIKVYLPLGIGSYNVNEISVFKFIYSNGKPLKLFLLCNKLLKQWKNI